MKNLSITVEKNEGHFWGVAESKNDFMPTGQGETVEALIQNIKESIEDYVEHEGKNDKFWSKIDLNTINFEIKYDLEAFFEQFNELNISAIATRAKLEPSLLRQYKTGKKNPSESQVKKIEVAIHELGKQLMEIELI